MASEKNQSEIHSKNAQREPRYLSNVTQTFQLNKTPLQTYIGETLLNNLHGSGIYSTDKPNGKIYIDGLFYCNKLEGYSHVYYEGGSSFQGLFKENRRFGPGVFTYPTGEQDVGIWNGFSLVRLSTVDELFLPVLAESYGGLAQLRRYRYVVPVGIPHFDTISAMLQTFAEDGVSVKHAEKLFNSYIRNRSNLFFNTSLFDDHYFGDQLKNVPEELKRLEDQLKKIETILITIQEVKPVLFEKIEYCKTCCFQAENIESGISSLKSGTEVLLPSIKELNLDDVRSTMTDNMTYDDTVSYSMTTSFISLPEVIETIYQGTCVCDEEMDIENLAFLEEQYEDLMEEELFYTNLKIGLRERLRKVSLDMKTNLVPEANADEIKDIIAWNNEKLMIDILKHCFLHRKFEGRINLKISAIFESERFTEFSHRGPYESDCDNFLKESGSGYLPKVLEYLRKPNMHVNVTDARGNNAVFFAAAKHSTNIIQVLINFGANLNQINDEGLTPLNMCLLSYLAVKNKIVDWERAFVQGGTFNINEESLVWYPGISIPSMKSKQPTQSLKRGTVMQTYLFNTGYRGTNSIISVDELTSTGSKADDQFKKESEDGAVIISLLKFGANPDIGEVPFPALILSMYSENSYLVEEILKSGANIRVETPEENLNCLHIIASLQCNNNNTEICSVLLKYGCDPNVKTIQNHWPEQNSRIMGNCEFPEEFDDLGKNPLHMLCIRRDFRTDQDNSFPEMAKLLIDSGIDINETYLGLNALELAILSGNLKLVEFLLKTSLIDPHRLIDPIVGNTLTLFLSERFKDILPVDECKNMIELLVNFNVNPLHKVGEYENVIEFMERNDGVIEGKKGAASKRSDDAQLTLKNLLKSMARKMIVDGIGIKAVEYLYNLAEANLLDAEEVKVLAEYLTAEQFIENLKLIFEQGKIPIGRFDGIICQKVLDFIRLNKKQPKMSKKVKSKLQVSKSDPKTDPFENFDFDNVLESIEVDVEYHQSDENHEVCFQCLKSHDKTLVTCPRCGMLYFCSTQCNKINLKQKNNEHVCALNIFEHAGELVTDKPGLMELCKIAENKCKEKYLEKKRRQKELRIKMEEDEKRLDIYGTRRLHMARKSSLSKLRKFSVSYNASPDVRKTKYQSRYDRPSDKSLKSTKTVATTSKVSYLSIALEEKLQRLSTVGEKQAEREKLSAPNMKHKITQVPKKTIRNPEHDKCALVTCRASNPGKEVVSRFEVLPNLEEPYIIVRKTTKDPPERTKFFIQLLKKYFPNVDLSFLIVPYICYADGHLYYQFSDEKPSCRNYSLC